MYNTDLPARADLPSTGKLLRSTGLAALIAAGLLVTTILPAEYGIDPTGIGRAIGLTRMGEIKMSLANEAAGEVGQAAASMPDEHVEVAAAAPAASTGEEHGDEHGGAGRREPSQAPAAQVAASASPAPAQDVAPGREHVVRIRLKPGEAAEIKLTMQKDSSVRYEWSAEGGGVNYDTHGDPVNAPKGFYHGYGKGRNQTDQSGTLRAAFDGKHGWFWRNRSGGEVEITLKTSGEYGQIERVL